MDIAEKLARGRIVHQPAEPRVSYGFGDAQQEPSGPEVPAYKTAGFYWPLEEHSSIAGDITPEQKAAEEAAALEYVESLGHGAAILLWRRLPEWVSDRSFDTNETRHKLTLRGAFAGYD